MSALEQVQRTHNKKWAEIINRMREGEVTDQDITDIMGYIKKPQELMVWVCNTHRTLDPPNAKYGKTLACKDVHTLVDEIALPCE
jgi:hypothetical protein